MSPKIAIATSTLYNPHIKSDRIRANLTKRFIEKATALDYKVFIIDGGSDKSLLEDFSDLGANVSIQSKKGMGYGRRMAIKLASQTDSEIVIWSEPEKEAFIKEISKAVQPILDKQADFVIPRRKSMQSYPLVQQYSEPLGNWLYRKLTGLDLDMYFGPKIMKKEKTHYFLDYKKEYGDLWDSIQIPILDAIFNKERVIGVDIDYNHPSEQTAIEENSLFFYRRRIEQLTNQLNAVESHWKKLNREKI